MTVASCMQPPGRGGRGPGAELDLRVHLEQSSRAPFNRDFDRPTALVSEVAYAGEPREARASAIKRLQCTGSLYKRQRGAPKSVRRRAAALRFALSKGAIPGAPLPRAPCRVRGVSSLSWNTGNGAWDPGRIEAHSH